jgi:hypothetical protein
MNIIELQEQLKNLPEQALVKEMQQPTGNAPQFLVLTELKRRKRMRDDYNRQQAADMPTVAEEAVTAAGVPQGGIMQMAGAMAPKSSIAQNTAATPGMEREPTRMAQGGIVKMNRGGFMATPDGQGNYIVTQGGVRVAGTPIYPDFMSANMAVRSLRGGANTSDLGDVAPIVQDFVPSSQIAPPSDPMSSASEDDIRRSLQQRQAAGVRPDATVPSAIGSGPLGRAFMDEYRADMSGMKGFESGGEGLDVEDSLPVLISKYQQQTMDSVPSVGGATASEDQRADEVAQMEMSRLAGGIPLADMTAEMIDNKPVDFDATTDQLDALRGSVDETIANASAELESSTLSDALKRRPGIRTSPLDQPGIVSGKTPTEKANEFIEYFKGLKTPDDQNPMVDLVESGIESTKNILTPEFTGREDAPFIRPSKLKSNDFILAPDQGYPFPEDVDTTFSSTETSPETDPYNLKNIIPAATKSSTTEELVEAATEIMEQRKGLPDSMLEVEDDPVTRVIKSIDDGAEELVLSPTKGDEEVGGDGGDGGSDKPTPPSDKPTPPAGPRGGSGSGSIESRIEKMLADREKSAEADKWLALAQTGLALMSSKNPTLGGAIGEAGLVGLGAMQKSKAQYDKDVLGLMAMQEKIAARKDANAYRNAALQARIDAAKAKGSQGLSTSDAVDLYQTLLGEQTTLTKALETGTDPITGEAVDNTVLQNRIVSNELEINRLRAMLGIGSNAEDLSD